MSGPESIRSILHSGYEATRPFARAAYYLKPGVDMALIIGGVAAPWYAYKIQQEEEEQRILRRAAKLAEKTRNRIEADAYRVAQLHREHVRNENQDRLLRSVQDSLAAERININKQVTPYVSSDEELARLMARHEELSQQSERLDGYEATLDEIASKFTLGSAHNDHQPEEYVLPSSSAEMHRASPVPAPTTTAPPRPVPAPTWVSVVSGPDIEDVTPPPAPPFPDSMKKSKLVWDLLPIPPIVKKPFIDPNLAKLLPQVNNYANKFLVNYSKTKSVPTAVRSVAKMYHMAANTPRLRREYDLINTAFKSNRTLLKYLNESTYIPEIMGNYIAARAGVFPVEQRDRFFPQ